MQHLRRVLTSPDPAPPTSGSTPLRPSRAGASKPGLIIAKAFVTHPRSGAPRSPFFPSSCVRAPSSSCHRVEAGARALHIAKPPLVGTLRCSFWPFCIRQDETLKNTTRGVLPPIFFYYPPRFTGEYQKRPPSRLQLCARKNTS